MKVLLWLNVQRAFSLTLLLFSISNINGQESTRNSQRNLNYEIVLSEALESQLLCDSMQTELITSKNLLRIEQNNNKRKILIASITSTKTQIDIEQAKTDALFKKAESLKKPRKITIETKKENNYIVLEKEINGLKVYSYKSLSKNKNISDVKLAENKLTNTDNSSKLIKSDFAILSVSPYSKNKPIPTNKEIPDGLLYRIQLGVFGEELPMDAFGGLSPISAETIKSKNLTKYFVGYFNSSKEARAALIEVKSFGFKDAFIVPYLAKKKITMNEARELEFSQEFNIF